MATRRRTQATPRDAFPHAPQSPLTGADWNAFIRRVERKRRLLNRRFPSPPPIAEEYYAKATCASFLLDGLDVTLDEVYAALGHGSERIVLLRSRQSTRLRNHAAILHHIENDLQQNVALTVEGVIRWYTTISSGLSTSSLDQVTESRLDEVVRRINSPQLRLHAALQEIATTHVRILHDSLVPAFNGILARLLLRYHLGRCNLPSILFDPEFDKRTWTTDELVRRIVELLEQSYDAKLKLNAR